MLRTLFRHRLYFTFYINDPTASPSGKKVLATRLHNMRYRVTVKPNQKIQRIEKTLDGFLAFLKSPAHEGKANQELIKALARELNIAKSRIAIISGLKSKIKIVEII